MTDPWVAGIGGGCFAHYDARTHRVSTLDGRETTPAAAGPNRFIDPSTGKGADLRPSQLVARAGFAVGPTSREQPRENAKRFGQFASTSALFLPGGALPAVGSTLRNDDLASTYEQIGRRGIRAPYGGGIGQNVVHTVQNLPLASGATLKPRPGRMTLGDLWDSSVLDQPPTHVRSRGDDVHGRGPARTRAPRPPGEGNNRPKFKLGLPAAARASPEALRPSR